MRARLKQRLNKLSAIVYREEESKLSSRLVGFEDELDDRGFTLLAAALKACSSIRDLETGKIIDADVGRDRCSSSIFVASALVSMYAHCGSMAEAQRAFDRAGDHDVAMWNALMLGYAADGNRGELVMELFARMQQNGCFPDARSFLAALKACTSLASKEPGTELDPGRLAKISSLKKGIAIHDQAARTGFTTNIFVINALVDMYAKCGSMENAQRAFQTLPYPIVAPWNSLILGYADCGEEDLALDLYWRMKSLPRSGCSPDSRTFVAAIKACTNLAGKEESKIVDGKLVKIKALEKGAMVHSEAAAQGFDHQIYVASSLVSMYSRCGSMIDACRVFDSMPDHDVVSRTAMMLGFAENGEAEKALEIFHRLQQEQQQDLDAQAYLVAFKACALLAVEEDQMVIGKQNVRIQSLERGMAIHSRIVRSGSRIDSEDLFVASALVDMYAKCGSLFDARRVFDRMPAFNVVSWNSLILGYAENGESTLCLDLFFAGQRFVTDTATYVGALKACACLAAEEDGRHVGDRLVKVKSLEVGMSVHARAKEAGVDLDTFVGNTLVDIYAKCGSVLDARWVFDRMPNHNLVTWTAMILGYADNGQPAVALDLLSCLLTVTEVEPDHRTFAAAAKACAELAEIASGKALHAEVIRRGLDAEAMLANSVVDLYSKCGSMRDAQLAFDAMAARDTVTWTALMAGYTRHGDTHRVFCLYHAMQEEGYTPYDATFVCVLTACSHAGMVDRAKQCFDVMKSTHGITPSSEHYHCLIDTLGRANRMNEALEIVRDMPFEANRVTWRTILGSCHKWRNREVGRIAFESLVELDEKDGTGYTLMSNIYKWEEDQGVVNFKS